MMSSLCARRFGRALAIVPAIVLARSALVAAQASAPRVVAQIDVGSVDERFLRVLQVAGAIPLYPWSIRPFAPPVADSLLRASTAPIWGDRLRSRAHTRGALSWEALPIDARTVYNTAFPYGFNDGPVWAGRGVTSSLNTGIAARYRWVTLQVAPTAFIAQNAAFRLREPNLFSGAVSFANGYYPTSIDVPQRFGPDSYGRIDAGQSTLEVDAGVFRFGGSTANESWGPAIEHPIILGNNAAGFPHAFFGTSKPLNVWIGKIHGIIQWGRLDQSAYAPDTGLSPRFASGAVGSFTPRGIPGLELGFARFFHQPWPRGGFFHGQFGKPIEQLLKSKLAGGVTKNEDNPFDNQLASVFARWVFPSAGVEVYGEYGREDHNQNTRDLFEEIDHDAAYLLGIQRVWHGDQKVYWTARAEVLNTRLSHLNQASAQTAWYVHAVVHQGHTERGEVLGSAGGMGGGAVAAAIERYAADGKWTFRWDRIMRGEQRVLGNLPDQSLADVMHALGVERLVSVRSTDVTAGATGVWNFNRDARGDVFNLNLALGVRAHW